MSPRLTFLAVAALAAAFAALLTGAAASRATFVGADGPVVFERFASAREDDHSAQIFTRAADGSIAQLTHFAGGAFHPSVSPDGSHIVFERWFAKAHKPDETWVMNADGSGARRLVTGCAGRCIADDAPSYSPDGARVVFERVYGPIIHKRFNEHDSVDYATSVDLMVVDAAGGAPTRIARYGTDPQPGYGSPRWSPDGTHLLLALGTFKHPTKHTRVSTSLFVLDANGAGARRITPWALGAAAPDWSPDGRRIAFNSEGGHSPAIYVVGADGSGLTDVVPAHRDFGAEPVWSPDGTQLAFSYGDEGEHDRTIYTARPDGSDLQEVVGGPRMAAAPTWSAAR